MSRQSTKISYEDSQYESVPTSSEDSLHIPRSRSRRRNLLPFLAGVIAASFIALVIFFVHSSIRTSNTIKTHEVHADQSQKTAAEIDAEVERLDWNYCGESSAEAIERGCSMEPLFYGWFPSQCVYQELTDKFPVFEDRTYYSDWNLTERVLPEDLWTGKFATVYTPKYHDEHCLYHWRKLQYAVENRVEYIDPKVLSMNHENHCADQLSVACETAMNRAIIELGFYRCKKAPSW